jgi:hypothetical protein
MTALGLLLTLAAAPKPDLTLGLGEQQIITAPCRLQRLAVDARPPTLSRIAVGDSSVVDVKTIGNAAPRP